MQRINKRNRYRKAIFVKTSIAIAGLLISSAFFVFYSHRYKYVYSYGPLIGIIISGVGLSSLWVNDKESESKWIRFFSRMVLVIIFLSFFHGLWKLHSIYANYQLEKYGTEAHGVVVDVETHSSRRSGTSYHAIVKYDFNRKTYLQDILDNQHLYKYGDSLFLKCSTHDPEIIRVISYSKALKIKY